jgi:hypothetical protein
MIYVFGPPSEPSRFRLDENGKMLFRGDRPISIARKPFEALLLFVRKPHILLSTEELRRQLWRDYTVGDASIAQIISILRKILGDPSAFHLKRGIGYGFGWLVGVHEMIPSSSGTVRPRVQSPRLVEAHNGLRVFLCHASQDKTNVREIHRRLREDGMQPWLDEEDLVPGQDWQLEIPKAVRSADVVLVCLSKFSVSKEGYLQKEIRLALDAADEKPDGMIFLIPVKLEECELPDRLRKWQWLDYFKPSGHGQLLRALQARHASQGPIGRPEGSTVSPTESERSNKSRERWSALRAKSTEDTREIMARYFAEHDFLKADGIVPREGVASIFVGPGVTSLSIVDAILDWVNHRQQEFFDLSWHTVNSLVTSQVHAYATKHPSMKRATSLSLFPGQVDPEIGCVSGPETIAYAQTLKKKFSYLLIGLESFDLESGEAYCHIDRKAEILQACATMAATRKCLFVIPRAFRAEGTLAFTFDELAIKTRAVSIYTVSSKHDDFIERQFKRFTSQAPTGDFPPAVTLTIVTADGTSARVINAESNA